MSAERVLHVAAVVLLVCSFPLCALAGYSDVSAVLPVALVLSSVVNALLSFRDMLRGERERQAFLDEFRKREDEFRTKWFKPEESQ
jgi:hypothetical protein